LIILGICQKRNKKPDAFTDKTGKIRELSRAVAELSEAPEESKQKSLMQKSGEIIADILGEDMQGTYFFCTFAFPIKIII
jgi:hypothetical protein